MECIPVQMIFEQKVRSGLSGLIRGQKVDLNRIITLLPGLLYTGTISFQISDPVKILPSPGEVELTGIGMDLIPILAAKSLVQGNTHSFGFDIPERSIKSADGRHNDRSVAHRPKSVSEQLVPKEVDIQWITTDQQRCIILQHGKYSMGAVDDGHSALTDSIDSFVGMDSGDDWPE